MKIVVHAKPNKTRSMVEKIAENEFIVFTKERALESKANNDIVRQLAEYFDVSKSKVILISGRTSKSKLFEIK